MYKKITQALTEYLLKAHSGENIVFSPLSILMVLGMLSESLSGEGREEICRALGNKNSPEEFIAKLTSEVKKCAKSSALLSSNAVCVKKKMKSSIRKEYKQLIEKTFDGKVFSSDDIVYDVNVWAHKKTDGMIVEPCNPSMSDIVCFIMSAIAFKAKWDVPYEDEDVYEEEFTNVDGTVVNPMTLHSTEDWYIEDADFTGFLKSYQDFHYEFMALLPKDASLLSSVDGNTMKTIRRLDFSKLYRSYRKAIVDVTMPEFDSELNEDLIRFFISLGIKTAFSENADFSPVTDQPLQLDSILHSTCIEVNREGTKAASFMAPCIALGCDAPPEKKTVHLNRPFIYAIMDSTKKTPVFVGICNKVIEDQGLGSGSDCWKVVTFPDGHKDIMYVEPEDYFPEELRKKYGLGEYNTDAESGKSEKKGEDKKPKKE